MAFGDWIVGAYIRFSSNGPQVMQRIASATQAANAQFLRQQGLITKNEAAMLRYTRRLEEMRMAQIRLGTTIAGYGAGIGIASMGYAIDQAGQLQRILIGIKNVTGANAGQMAQFRQQAFDLGDRFGMSVTGAAEVMRTAARMSAGQLTQAQMQRVMPTIANFAMLMHQNRGMSTDNAAEVGISLAHMFRAYTPDALKRMIDMNLRMSEMMGESPEAARRQMAYYMPLFKSLNVSDDASMAMMALLSRAGFRNKVGTNVRAFLLQTLGPLQLTQHAQAGKNAMLNAMGITDAHGNIRSRFTKNGQYDMFGVLYQMAAWEKAQLKNGKTLEDINKVLYGTFGKQGGTIASLFSDPQMVHFLGSIRKYLNNPAVSMAEQTRNTQQGLLFQAGRTGANLQALATELAWPWLSSLTKRLTDLGTTLHGWQKWLHQNPQAEKNIGLGFSILTGVASARFTIGLARTVLAIPKLTGSIIALGATADKVAGQIRADSLVMGGGGVRGGARTAEREAENPGFWRKVGGWFGTGFSVLTGFNPATAAALAAVGSVGGLLYGEAKLSPGEHRLSFGGNYGLNANGLPIATNGLGLSATPANVTVHREQPVHIDSVVINMPKGTPDKQASLFIESLRRKTGPSSMTIPNAPVTVGNLAFGH